MTVNAPAIGSNTDTAQAFRLAMSGLWVPTSATNVRTGVTSTPVLTGTGNFTATVSAFTAIVDGTSNSLQGAYPVAVDVATTITIGAANTQPRIDLISLQIQDNAYDGSGFSRGQLVVTAGTPAGSPVAPTAPANSLSLWTVPVAANATSVVFSSATAVYAYTAAAGGIVPVSSSADQPAAASGAQYRHRMDVTAAAGSTSPLESSTDGVTWTPVYSAPGAWTVYTPTWATVSSPQPAIGNGQIIAHYVKVGRWVTVQIHFLAGSTTTFGTGVWEFTLPVATDGTIACNLLGLAVLTANGASATNTLASITRVSTTQFSLNVPSMNNYNTATAPFTFASGSTIDMNFTYQSAS